MKKKRLVMVLALTLSVFGSITAMANSASNTYNYGSNKSAKVHGYIDFLEGPLTIQDKVNYNVNLYGTDASKCTVAYKVIVDNGTKAQGVLNKSKYSVSKTDVKVGYGHEYAKLQLDFNGKTKTLTSYAD